MEISANFAFLQQEFPYAAESASYAELISPSTRSLPCASRGCLRPVVENAGGHCQVNRKDV